MTARWDSERTRIATGTLPIDSIALNTAAKDTKPEHLVRSLIHRLGYRYRLHVRKLPGCPDLVFPSRRKVIFVHGCFWHRHHCRKGQSTPKTRAPFWKEKLESNKDRDAKRRRKLRRLGWSVLTVWECQTAPTKTDRLTQRLCRFLEGAGGTGGVSVLLSSAASKGPRTALLESSATR